LNSTVEKCQNLIKKGWDNIALLTCNSIMATIQSEARDFNTYDIRIPCEKPPLCYDFSNLDKLMAKQEVQESLGVSDKSSWNECDPLVHQKLMGDWMNNLVDDLPPLLEAGIQVLIYAGDQDFICNWMGNHAWVKSMPWSGQKEFNAASVETWFGSDGKSAGEHTTYKNLTFLRVYQAGHMVPMDQPLHALDMIKALTQN